MICSMDELCFKGWLVTNGITQKEIAELLGLSYQSVCMKVNGKRDFTLDEARKICAKYKISADVFMPKMVK